jgi:hypothetical protein
MWVSHTIIPDGVLIGHRIMVVFIRLTGIRCGGAPAFYAGYGYYPHRWGYWDSYPRYGYGHSNYSRSFVTRNSGYQRGGNNWRNSGVGRSSFNGTTGTIYNGRSGSTGGSINIPRHQAQRTQLNGTATLKLHRGSNVSSSSRGSARSRSAALRRGGNSQGRSQSRARQSHSSAPAGRSSQSAPSQRNNGGGQRSGGSGRSQR